MRFIVRYQKTLNFHVVSVKVSEKDVMYDGMQ